VFILGRIKDFWSKLKYWQKGLVLGIMAAVVNDIIHMIIGFRYAASSCKTMLFSCNAKTLLFFSLLPIIILTIYGLVMGILAKKILQQEGNIKTNMMNYVIFVVILIISFVALYYFLLRHINLLILLAYNPPY